MKESPSVREEIPHVGHAANQLIGQFPDERAAPLRILGLLFCVLGVALLAAGFFSDLGNIRGLAIGGIVAGAAAFLLGSWRGKNRVLVYKDGLAFGKGKKVEYHPWREIEAIFVEQEVYRWLVGAAMFLTSRRVFVLRRRDGIWVRRKIPRISNLAMKAIQESWDGWRHDCQRT